LDVVLVTEAVDRSLEQDGRPVQIEPRREAEPLRD